MPSPGSAIVVGFWRRVLADLVDALALGAFGWAFAYPLRYALSELGSRAAWIGLVVSLLYAGVLQTRFGRGQTLGKRALGIQVLRRDGAYLGLGPSLVRYLVVSFVFYNGMYGSLLASAPPQVAEPIGSIFLVIVLWVFLACFVMIPLHPLKRGLHDLMSGSVVTYKGRYDAATLAQLENPRREKWLLALTGMLAVLLFGGVFWSARSVMKRVDMTRLTALQHELAKKYNVLKVTDTTFNRTHRILVVEIWVPLRVQQNPIERERVRADVLARTRAEVPKLEDFENVRVWLNSGFQLGIANLHSRD